MGPEAQCVLPALRLHHSTRLSYGKVQQITKQGKEICTLGNNGEIRNTPTGAMEALICLSPLDLVVQAEAR